LTIPKYFDMFSIMKDKTYPITIDPKPLTEKPEWSIRSHINKRLSKVLKSGKKRQEVKNDLLSNMAPPLGLEPRTL
jgi:hypothetical protein